MIEAKAIQKTSGRFSRCQNPAMNVANDRRWIAAHSLGFSLEFFNRHLGEIHLLDASWWDQAAPAGRPVWATHPSACHPYNRTDEH